MKIKIVKNSGFATYWYNDKIGRIYNVIEEDVEDYEVTDDDGMIGAVLKCDCEIVPERAEIKHRMAANEKRIKVRIKSCCNPDYWYKDRIGEEYEITGIYGRLSNEASGYFLAEDCEIVPEHAENNHQMTAEEALKFYETGLGAKSEDRDAVLLRLSNAGYVARTVPEKALDIIADLYNSDKISYDDYDILVAVCGAVVLKEKAGIK